MVEFELISGPSDVADSVKKYQKWQTRYLRTISRPEILRAIMFQLDKPEWENYRVYALLCYLTGGRRNEVVCAKKKDFESAKVMHNGKQYDVLLITLANSKNRENPTKQLPLIRGIDMTDDTMLDIIEAFISKFKPEDYVFFHHNKKGSLYDKYLRKVKIQIDYREPQWKISDILTIKMCMFPHYLRHCRLTHLGPIGTQALITQAGWTSPRQGGIGVLMDTYVHRGWEVIAKQRLMNNV